jgi:hypothetical protein
MAENNNLEILTLATVQQKILRNEEVCHLVSFLKINTIIMADIAIH